MKNYSEVLLPIVEEANKQIYAAATVLSVIGLITLGLSVGLLEIGSLRTTGVITALIFMITPFALRFVIDKYKKTGVIRFSDNEILVKLNGQEPTVYTIDTLTVFDYNIVDFEGETKAVDLVRTSSRMNVRSGSENTVFWVNPEGEFQYNFKLENELQKRKSIYFLKMYKTVVLA